MSTLCTSGFGGAFFAFRRYAEVYVLQILNGAQIDCMTDERNTLLPSAIAHGNQPVSVLIMYNPIPGLARVLV